MLNEEEEKKLDHWIREMKKLYDLDAQMYYWINSRKFKWLCDKLKEVNTEASRYSEELQKTNQELARMHEVYD